MDANEQAIEVFERLGVAKDSDERLRQIVVLLRAAAIASRVYGADDETVIEQLKAELAGTRVEHVVEMPPVFGRPRAMAKA